MFEKMLHPSMRNFGVDVVETGYASFSDPPHVSLIGAVAHVGAFTSATTNHSSATSSTEIQHKSNTAPPLPCKNNSWIIDMLMGLCLVSIGPRASDGSGVYSRWSAMYDFEGAVQETNLNKNDVLRQSMAATNTGLAPEHAGCNVSKTESAQATSFQVRESNKLGSCHTSVCDERLDLPVYLSS